MDTRKRDDRRTFSERHTRVSLDLDDEMLAMLKDLAGATRWQQSRVLRLALNMLSRAAEVRARGGSVMLLDAEGAEVYFLELELLLSRIEKEAACALASTNQEQELSLAPTPSAP